VRSPASAEGHRYKFRLIIAGMTPLSTEAIRIVKALCEELLSGLYYLEVVDICQQPPEVLDEQIIEAPTLVRRFPLPHRRMVGNLPELERLMQGLEVR
jgi:circadian clock protein KaiB